MKTLAKKNNSSAGRRRIIIEMIEAGFRLSEALGRHPLTQGCNCMACIHHRKRILEITGKDWKFKL